MVKPENHLFLRANLNIELFETKTVSEELVRSYNEIKGPTPDGSKDYFAFFQWVSKYMLNNGMESSALTNIIDQYKKVNELNEKDEELIYLSFKVNEMLIQNSNNINEEDTLNLISNAIQKCAELEVTDSWTLLSLYRLKLRYLLISTKDMTREKIEQIKEAKNKTESLLMATNESVEGMHQSIFMF